MIIDVCTYQITVDYTGYPEMIVPRKIVIMVDDSTYAISVEIRNGSGGVEDSPVSGPNLFLGINGLSTLLTPPPYYQYCDGTTLRKISLINTFPYATWGEFPGDSQCVIAPVCDLEIASTYTTVPTTDPDSPDGEIQVSATSSNGVIKYDLTSTFDYATGTNTTGLFTGLIPGDYTIYAKDEIGCMDSITITVEVTREYGVKLIGEYNTVNGFDTKVEIHERGYDGSSSEMCFGGDPFILDYDECGKFSPFVASHCVINLLEEVEDEFLELFTNDDLKYLVKYFKNFGAGYVLVWTGYVIPEFYSKPFVRADKNYVTVKASDQLGLMKDDDFLDASGNKYRGILSQFEILRQLILKTNLELNIRIQDDIFETTMDEAITPMLQAFVDVRIFYDEDNKPNKCDEVLSKIIACKSGLRMFQAYGYWWLVRSEWNVGTFDYIEYDINGVLVGTGSYSPVQNLVSPTSTGLMWANSSQLEIFETNYGKFSLTHHLEFDDNLIDEGRFEAEDIVELSNGNKTFKNWSVNTIQPGIKYGLEYVDNGDSKGAFFMDFRSAGGNQEENSLYSIEIPIESNTYAEANLIKFRFQVNVFPTSNVPWIRVAWQVRLTYNSGADILYLKDANGWVDDEKQDLYVSSYDRFQALEITAPMPNVADLTGTVRIAFFMHNHVGRDFDSIADLKALPTTDVSAGVRYLVNDTPSGNTYFYELNDGIDAESSPDTLRPDDYVLFTNNKIWVLKGKIYAGQFSNLVNKVLLDNVQLSYIPFDPITSLNFQPPTEVKYEYFVTKFNRIKYEEDFYLGDLPTIENGINLYRGFLRLEDGTPTDLWHRLSVTEEKKLLNIALDERVAQLKDVQKKITADVLQKNVYYSFLDSLSYDSRRFLNGKYVLSDINNIISLYALETVTNDSGEPPVIPGAFSNAYSDAYDNGS